MKKLVCAALVVFSLYSCTDDNDITVDNNNNIENGYLIVNEGNFQSANGSITYLSNDFSTIQENLFKTVNQRSVGDVPQSLAITDKFVFIVVNNSNTIEIVDRKTFKSVNTISSNLFNPRFILAKNNKLYVTNGNKAEISVFNAETFEYISSISLNYTAENIVATNDYIYTANGFYSGGTLVEVINPATDKNTEDISFDNPINGLTSDSNAAYVLDTNDKVTNITKIQANTKSVSKVLSQTNSRYLVADQNQLYYTSGTGIYKLDTNLNTTANKLFDVPNNDFSTLYGFNVINGSIFTSDANGFTDKGKATVYNQTGNILKTFTTGIGPCGFYKF